MSQSPAYQIAKVPQPCGHAFQVSVPDEYGIGKVVAEIRFHGQDRDMAILAGRAATAMVEAMAPIWRLTPEGPRQPVHVSSDTAG